MEEKAKSFKQRLRAGELTKTDVARRLAELAFGRSNDCVRLVLEDAPPVDALELDMLSEIKRNEKGTVEIKLVDRLAALRELAVLVQEQGSDLESFLQALQESGDRT